MSENGGERGHRSQGGCDLEACSSNATYQHVPEERAVVDTEDLAGTLTGETLVDESQSGVGGQEGRDGNTSSSGLGDDVLLLSAAKNNAGCKK